MVNGSDPLPLGDIEGDAGSWGSAYVSAVGRPRSTRHHARGEGLADSNWGWLMKRFRWKIFCKEGLGSGRSRMPPKRGRVTSRRWDSSSWDYSWLPAGGRPKNFWCKGPPYSMSTERGSAPDLVEQSPFRGHSFSNSLSGLPLRKASSPLPCSELGDTVWTLLAVRLLSRVCLRSKPVGCDSLHGSVNVRLKISLLKRQIMTVFLFFPDSPPAPSPCMALSQASSLWHLLSLA